MPTLSFPEVMQISGLTAEEELAHLENLCKAAPRTGHLIELGTYNGRATAVMCLSVGDQRVISVDNYKMSHHGTNTYEYAKRNLATLGLFPVLLQGQTTEMDIYPDAYQLALLFIDSHHHPQTFLLEMATYGALLRPGSIVAVHDIGRLEYPGFTEEVLEYFQSPRWTDEGKVGSLQAWRLEEPWAKC